MSRPIVHASRLGLAAALLCFRASPAAADPIFTPLFASLLTAAGVTGSIGAVSVVSIGASILSGITVTALGIGLQLLLTPKPPKPENGSIATQQDLPNRTYAYGRVRVAGYVAFLEENSGNLYCVQALLGHLVNAFTGFWLNDDKVTVIDGVVQEGDDGRYDAGVTIDTRRGLATETAYAPVVAAFPDQWSTNHRGDNVASMFVYDDDTSAKNFSKRYPYQRTQGSAEIESCLVYDPRDPAQSASDPSTWTYSAEAGQAAPPGENTVLALMHFRCFSPYGPQKDFSKAILPELDQWIAEANICDEQVALKEGGTEPRYTIGGWTTTAQDQRSTLKAMLDPCDGFHVVRGDGTEIVTVGKFRDLTTVLTDADIIGFSRQTDLPAKDSANSFKATYTSAANGYVTVDTDSIEWTEDQADRGSRNPVTSDLPWCPSTGQASRINKRVSIRAMEPMRGRLNLRLSGINACYERWVRVQSNRLPWLANVVIEVTKATISIMTASCTIEFVLSGAQIDDYNAATDESSVPPVPARPATVGPPIPANPAVVASEAADASGGASIYLNVTIDSPLSTSGSGIYNTSLGYRVQYRIADIGGGVPGNWVPQDFNDVTPTAARLTLSTAPVPVGALLDVQVASLASKGTPSPFSVTRQVSTVLSSTAPGPMLSLTATGGSGTINFSAKSPNSPNFAAVQFWRGAVGSTFATAVPAGAVQYGAPNMTMTLAVTGVAHGSYIGWATALTMGGVASTPTGPTTTITVT